MRTAEKTILKLDQEEDQRRLIHRHFVLPYVCMLCNIQEEQHCSLSCSHKTRIAVGDDLANTNKDASIIVFTCACILVKLSENFLSVFSRSFLSRNLSIDHFIFSLNKP